jgi:hypothetical protein
VLPNVLRELPRRGAVIVIAVAAVVLAVAIVLLWDTGESGSTASFCSSVRTGDNPLDVFDSYDPNNVATAREQLQRGVDRLQELERAAPGELRPHVKVLVDVAQQLVSALEPSAKDKTIPDFASEFDRVREASANVTRFAADNCGVQLESTSTAGPVTLPPGTPSSAP